MLVNVTVLLTTCFTHTDFCGCVAEAGEAIGIVRFPSIFQSTGENGERRALLFGESVAGGHIGDCGMRSLRREVGVRAEFGGRMKGEGGIMGAEEEDRP